MCLGFGFLLVAQGCKSYESYREDYGEFQYQEEGNDVYLALSSGETVKMRFGKSSVKIYECHQYGDTVYEIIAFVYDYSEEKGYEISRGKAELVGECRLHNGLYSVGYKRKQTQDSDLEYTADSRWYVNWLSKFLGW